MRELAKAGVRRLIRGTLSDQLTPVRAEAGRQRQELADLRALADRQRAELDTLRVELQHARAGGTNDNHWAELAALRAELQQTRTALARQTATLDQVRDWLARLPTPAAPTPVPGPFAGPHLGSDLCRVEHLDRPDFRRWAERMHTDSFRHRKQWEYCYIAQLLAERGLLRPGARGLGFAVGKEPLVALFAAHGVEVVATDLDPSAPSAAGWAQHDQHAGGLADLNRSGICPPAEFARLVRFRPADMTAPPADLRGFDFLWSSCAIEHVGSLTAAREAVLAMMACLRPGGLAIHTTEYNMTSAEQTTEVGGNVIWRRKDVAALEGALNAAGHTLAPLDLDRPATFANTYVDDEPYHQRLHLNLRLDGFASTSIGLVIRAAGG